MDDLGTFTRQGDQTTLRFERHYPCPVETVWIALTTPERLADSLGAAIVEPFVGGRFELFVDRPDPSTRMLGQVLQWTQPTRLEVSWKVGTEPETTVRFDLQPDGPDATRLTLIHGAMSYKWIGLVFPGWHSLLERLKVTFETGRPTPDARDRWRKLQTLYVQHYDLQDVMLEPPAGHGG